MIDDLVDDITRPDRPGLFCERCGAPIKATTKRARYCSRACQQVAYRHRGTQLPCDDTSPLSGPLCGSDGGLKPYTYPERADTAPGPTPGWLQGDDCDLDYYDDGYPVLPACLDRRSRETAS